MANILIVDKDRYTGDMFNIGFSSDHLIEILCNAEDCVKDKLKRNPDFIFVAIEFIDVLYDFFRLFPDVPVNVTMDIHDFKNDGLKEIEKAREHGFDFKVCRKPIMVEQVKEIINS
ncbi:MAG: hypothetical protein ACUZ8E_05275 [Candidatus Anammoxibacter sp.]